MEQVSKKLREGLKYRNQARYDRQAKIGFEEAEGVIKLAEQLIAALEKEHYGTDYGYEDPASTSDITS